MYDIKYNTKLNYVWLNRLKFEKILYSPIFFFFLVKMLSNKVWLNAYNILSWNWHVMVFYSRTSRKITQIKHSVLSLVNVFSPMPKHGLIVIFSWLVRVLSLDVIVLPLSAFLCNQNPIFKEKCNKKAML